MLVKRKTLLLHKKILTMYNKHNLLTTIYDFVHYFFLRFSILSLGLYVGIYFVCDIIPYRNRIQQHNTYTPPTLYVRVVFLNFFAVRPHFQTLDTGFKRHFYIHIKMTPKASRTLYNKKNKNKRI